MSGKEKKHFNNCEQTKGINIFNYGSLFHNAMEEINNRIHKLGYEYCSIKDSYKMVSYDCFYRVSKILSLVRSRLVNEISLNVNNGLISHNFNEFSTTSRRTKRFSKRVINALKDSYYNLGKYPSEFEKMRLVDLCSITVKQVNSWFTNKRSRDKHAKLKV